MAQESTPKYNLNSLDIQPLDRPSTLDKSITFDHGSDFKEALAIGCSSGYLLVNELEY